MARIDESEHEAQMLHFMGLGPSAPLRKAAAETDPLSMLMDLGFERKADGSLGLTPSAFQAGINRAASARDNQEAMTQIRAWRVRQEALSTVPTTSRWVYPDTNGMGIRKGGNGIGQTVETLRMIREKSFLIKCIHAARHRQVLRMSRKWSGRQGDVGWRVVHKNHHAYNARPPDSIKPYIRQVEDVLACPAPGYQFRSLGSLLVGLEEDLLTINRPVCEPLYSGWDRSRVVGLKPVDGGIIWHTTNFIRRWTSDNPAWWAPGPKPKGQKESLEKLSSILKADLFRAHYVAVRDNVIESIYGADDLFVAPILNRTDINYAGYYPSCAEECAEAALTFVNVWDFNGSYFTRGMMTDFFIGLSGNIHPADVEVFRATLQEATQGVARAHGPPVIAMPEGGEVKPVPLKQTNREMMFEVFLSLLLSLGCAIYRMHPSTINARPWEGGAAPSLQAPSQEKEIGLAQEEGLVTDLQHLSDNILTPIAQRCHPDLVFKWEFGEEDPQKVASSIEIRTRTVITLNEGRLEAGLDPIGFWCPVDAVDKLSEEDQKKWWRNPYNWINNPASINAIQSRIAQEDQAEQAAQQPPEPPPGEDPDQDEQEAPDGYGQPPQEPDGFGRRQKGAPFGQWKDDPGDEGAPDPGPSQQNNPQPSQPSQPSASSSRPMAKGRRTTIVTIQEGK